MTQDRDDYMRRQEADHDLLRMRNSTQMYGRGIRPVVPPEVLDFATIQADVAKQIEEMGSFEFTTGGPPPTPAERIHKLLRDSGISGKKLFHVMPGIANIILDAEITSFRKGSEDARSRLASRPGDGDTGG